VEFVFILLFLLVAGLTLQTPCAALAFFSIELIAFLIARKKYPEFSKRWACGYAAAFALVTAAVYLVPARERAWNASISGIGSGVLSVAEVRLERLYLTQSLFQLSTLLLFGGLLPSDSPRGRPVLIAAGVVFGLCTLWALTYQMP
jgi:hypothetical protein